MNPQRGFEDVALTLLAKGVSIDAPDADGNAPLHLAVLYANPALIRFLVSRGASLQLANAAGKTPAQLAEELQIGEAAEALRACALPPLPPAAPEVFVCDGERLVVRWAQPVRREGVPEATLFEVEALDVGSGERKSLGSALSGTSRPGGRSEKQRWRCGIRAAKRWLCACARGTAMGGGSGRTAAWRSGAARRARRRATRCARGCSRMRWRICSSRRGGSACGRRRSCCS